MVSFVTPLSVWVLVAASFVIGLAAVLRMAGPPPADAVTGVILLPPPLVVAIAGLFALAGLVFVAHLVRRGLFRRRPEDEQPEAAAEAPRVPRWLRTLTQILSLLNFLVLGYLLWRGTISFGGLLQLGAGAGSGLGSSLGRTFTESAPPLITWTFGALALAAGLGALALAVWVAMSDRAAVDPDPDGDQVRPAPLEAAVEVSLDELRSEPDARRAIIRCYARFERAAAESGVERKPWLTPMEFMREALARLPGPRTAVPTLTGLFELARFSQHVLGTGERDRALAALDEIRTAIAARDGGAGAS
jgi:hypothetical protein